MGLFTQEAKTDYNVPVELRMAQDAAKSQRQFTDQYLDPAIKENIGYESPRMKMKALTSGVDLTDGKAVQKVFMELQAMDPQEANGWLQSIKPVIAQHLDSIKIKEAQLKFTKAKNKPLVKQRWNLEGRPNFITEHATTALAGLEGHDTLMEDLQIAPNDQKEFIINAFLNKISKENDGKAYIADYKKKLKEANTNYMEFWGGKDNLDADLKAKPPTKNVKLKPTGTDTTAPDAFHTADPSKSQLSQGFNAMRANAKLRDALEDIRVSLYTFTPEFLMTDAELVKENLDDEIGDWISSGDAFAHFKTKAPAALKAFQANPASYYKAK